MERSDGRAGADPEDGIPHELEWVDAERSDDVESSAVYDLAADAVAMPPASAPTDAELEQLYADAVARLHRRRARHRAAAISIGEPWKSAPLRELEFCVIDLETTGATHGHDDDILEIGAVQVDGFELRREFTTLVDPRRPISNAARRVHGIDAHDVLAAPSIDQALPWLLETTRDRVLVFHNAGFDLGFLQRALVEAGRAPFTQPVLDTLVLARRTLAGRCALTSLAHRLRLVAEQPHRALSDARTTALLLVELLRLCHRAGLRRLEEIPALAAPGARARRRRFARVDPLVERLEGACRQQESLRVAYHVGAGVAPVELQIRALRLRGVLELEAFDELARRGIRLDVARIRSVHTRA